MKAQEAAQRIREGKVICFPTETFYGIGCDAFNEEAIKEVYRLKKRNPSKGLIVLISDSHMMRDVVEDIPDAAKSLMAKFWPGPLTIVMKKHKELPGLVGPGDGTVAVRMTSSQSIREAIRIAGTPIVAPSCNPEDREPAKSAQMAKSYFPGLQILDGEDGKSEAPSTIISMVGEPKIIREGAIPASEVLQTI